jgi:hypothetical protein
MGGDEGEMKKCRFLNINATVAVMNSKNLSSGNRKSVVLDAVQSK